MAGRPKQFSNAADKQRDYRERKKRDDSQLQEALTIFAEVQAEKVTLLNYNAYFVRHNQKMEVFVSSTGGYAQTLVGGYHRGNVSIYLANYMVRTGGFEFIRKDWSGSYYRVRDERYEA